MMRYAAVALSMAMGTIRLVNAQPETCDEFSWWSEANRACQRCTVCVDGQTVASACTATSDTVCERGDVRPPPSAGDGAANGERCTPWQNGATPCAAGLQCHAQWNNEQAMHEPAICYPDDMVFTESTHGEPVCAEDCADQFWCNDQSVCESMLRTDPLTCASDDDCTGNAGDGCGYSCLDGECAMWVSLTSGSSPLACNCACRASCDLFAPRLTPCTLQPVPSARLPAVCIGQQPYARSPR